jgi:hypothetical protein
LIPAVKNGCRAMGGLALRDSALTVDTIARLRLHAACRKFFSGLTIFLAAKSRKSRKRRLYFEPYVHFCGYGFC